MNRLKEFRIKANMNQSTVADFLGISRAAYTNIENGKRNLDSNVLLSLSELFNVSTDEMLGREPIKKQPDESIAGLREEVIQLLNGLSEEEYRRVEDFVAGLKAGREAGAAVQRSAHPEAH